MKACMYKPGQSQQLTKEIGVEKEEEEEKAPGTFLATGKPIDASDANQNFVDWTGEAVWLL